MRPLADIMGFSQNVKLSVMEKLEAASPGAGNDVVERMRALYNATPPKDSLSDLTGKMAEFMRVAIADYMADHKLTAESLNLDIEERFSLQNPAQDNRISSLVMGPPRIQ